MFRLNKVKELLNIRSNSLRRVEENMEELEICYRKTIQTQKAVIIKQNEIIENIKNLIFNYEKNNMNPYTLIRDVKSELCIFDKHI